MVWRNSDSKWLSSPWTLFLTAFYVPKRISSGAGREDYIDLEALLDEDKNVKKEAFLSVMELHEFNASKIKRILLQCVRAMEEFGVYCAAHVDSTSTDYPFILLFGLLSSFFLSLGLRAV